MNTKFIKILSPIGIIVFGIAGMLAIGATKSDDAEKKPIDTRPTVNIQAVESQDYQARLNSSGEVIPLEKTRLSAQVSGEVIYWHDNFVAGGLIAKGEVLFAIEKDNYEAALLQAEANLSQAKAILIEEEAQAAVAEREAKNIAKAKLTDLYLRKPQVLSARAAVKSAQAGLKIAQRDLDNCVIKAPYDALVVSRELGRGQFITQGAFIAELYNVEYAEIIFPIAGFDMPFVPETIKGLPVSIRTNQIASFERDAVIVRDLGIIDNATRMSQLIARIPDPYSLKGTYPQIKFGTYAEVQFIGKTIKNVYRLPQELVTNQRVWIVGPDQRLEPRNVTVLREEDEFLLIDQGLNNNDRVVTTLPNYPQKGMEVKLLLENADATRSLINSKISNTTANVSEQTEVRL